MVDEEIAKKVEAYFHRAQTITRDITAQAILAGVMITAEQYKKGK